MIKNARGQISIFFATTVLVLITFIAFIVNIGVFVKAKMNLQNAVDAAAFAGASVQARQLTNIGYLNWEMRNVYKEWMFKYYVLGNIALPVVENGASGTSDFMMEPYSSGTDTVSDFYNVPSVCVDFQASGNVSTCKKAMVPGLPRFSRTEVMGLEETMDTFVSSLSAEKAKDCAIRTSLNFFTNFTWGFNVTDETGSLSYSSLIEDAPEVATNRPGAFPAALELAMRIRQLEKQVNRPPYTGGVCLGGGGVNCNEGDIQQLVSNDPSPSNERVYKAFFSGFRNLGSHDCSGDGDGNDEFKCFFTLKELPLNSYISGFEFSPSNVLIPGNNPSNREKHYLDLKLQYINFATFFTMLAPNTTGRQNPDGSYEVGNFEVNGVKAENTAECVSTKVGMPIPGYPLGYVKNPDVMTYYAVKGQTRFLGRFSPFTRAFTLTAYAAAKPFGGRIGPMIADLTGDEVITPRTIDLGSLKKSSPYMSRLDQTPAALIDRFGRDLPAGTVYAPGVPLPMPDGSSRFFAQSAADPIGGKAPSDDLIYFVIPNIPYDFPNDSAQDPTSYFSPDDVQVISGRSPTAPTAGLYNPDIFNKLRANLADPSSNTISKEEIEAGIFKSRAPTKYDAHHYLVPTTEENNLANRVDSYGAVVTPLQTPFANEIANPDGQQSFLLNIYAPLVSSFSDCLYCSIPDLENITNQYFQRQTQAIVKYRAAMNIAAFNVFDSNQSSRQDKAEIGLGASQLLSDIDISMLQSRDVEVAKAGTPSCRSLNGQFVYFYLGTRGGFVRPDGCDPENQLAEMLKERWNALSASAKTYYQEVYVEPKNDDTKRALFSAYRPTQMNDADDQGTWRNTLNGQSINKWRNYYSTKFITLKSVATGDDQFFTSSNFTIFSEGNSTNVIQTIKPPTTGTIVNTLMNDSTNDFSRISH